MTNKASQKVTDCSGKAITRKVYNVVHHNSGVVTGSIKSKQGSQRVSFINGSWLILGRF